MTSRFARRDVAQPARSLRRQQLLAVRQPDPALPARYTVPAPSNAVATAIAFVPRQLGKPCQCGAARPDETTSPAGIHRLHDLACLARTGMTEHQAARRRR